MTGLVIFLKHLCLASSIWWSQKAQAFTGKSYKVELCRKVCSGSLGVLKGTDVIFKHLACEILFLTKGCSGGLSSGSDSKCEFI